MSAFDRRIRELYESGMNSAEAVAEQVIREHVQYFANSSSKVCLDLKERAKTLKSQYTTKSD